MNRAIVELTARQLLGKRRTMLMAAFALIPVLIAVIFRIGGDVDYRVVGSGPQTSAVSEQIYWTANTLFAQLIIGTLLPLVALIFGTAALGSEFEDGTAVYILSKPIPRWRIVLSKLVVAWGATAILVLATILIAGAISMQGAPTSGSLPGTFGIAINGPSIAAVLIGFSVATIGGALVYTCLFVMLSIVTSRALIAGLIYVFFWEALITRLFSGTRIFSVRQYTRGIAQAVSSTNDLVFEARLGGIEASFLLVLVSALSVAYAIRRLRRWEIGETT